MVMSAKDLRPMLAKEADLSKLLFPVFVQPKFDGIRMLIRDGVGLSRSLKRIPNKSVQSWVDKNSWMNNGLDGELIVGDPTATDVFQRTTSGVMSEGGTPDFKYYFFDTWDLDLPYQDRERAMYHWFKSLAAYVPDSRDVFEPERFVYVPSVLVNSLDELTDVVECNLEDGYEGSILRSPYGRYKYGRSTVNEGFLLKMKDFHDAEGQIIGFEELMHNDNEATIDALGYTRRSSHKAGMRPGNMLGKLVVELPPELGWAETEVRIGSGFDYEQRRHIWANQSAYLGKIVKYKYQKIGSKDAPRTPVFLGFRDAIDL